MGPLTAEETYGPESMKQMYDEAIANYKRKRHECLALKQKLECVFLTAKYKRTQLAVSLLFLLLFLILLLQLLGVRNLFVVS